MKAILGCLGLVTRTIGQMQVQLLRVMLPSRPPWSLIQPASEDNILLVLVENRSFDTDFFDIVHILQILPRLAGTICSGLFMECRCQKTDKPGHYLKGVSK
jgi:hypothetical protein